MFLFDVVGQKIGKKPNDDISALIAAYSSETETKKYSIQGANYTVKTDGNWATLFKGGEKVAWYQKGSDPAMVPNKGGPDEFRLIKYILQQEEQSKMTAPSKEKGNKNKEEQKKLPKDEWSITQDALSKNLQKFSDYAKENLGKKKIKYSKVKGGKQVREQAFTSEEEMLSDKDVQSAIAQYEGKRALMEQHLRIKFNDNDANYRTSRDFVRYANQLANWNSWQPEAQVKQTEEQVGLQQGGTTEQKIYDRIFADPSLKASFDRLGGREYAKFLDYISKEENALKLLEALEDGKTSMVSGPMGKKMVSDPLQNFLSANVLDDNAFKGGKNTFYFDLTSNPEKMLKNYVPDPTDKGKLKMEYQYDMSWLNKQGEKPIEINAVKGKQGGKDEEENVSPEGKSLYQQIEDEKKIDAQFNRRRMEKIDVGKMIGKVTQEIKEAVHEEVEKVEKGWKKGEVDAGDMETKHAMEQAKKQAVNQYKSAEGKDLDNFGKAYDEKFSSAPNSTQIRDFVREYRELENKKVETAPVQQEEVVDETHQGNTNSSDIILSETRMNTRCTVSKQR
jgi:hypothetical protein